MQCPQCQHENRECLKFCNQCGTPLSGHCAQCGFTNESGSKFCGECGTSLTVHASGSVCVQSMPQEAESEKRFQALLLAVIPLLQRERRVTYRTLKYVLSLDDALLEEIRRELAFKRLAIDEDKEGLVWIGETQSAATTWGTCWTISMGAWTGSAG